MFGDRIQLTELDNQILELEKKRNEIREKIIQRISYHQFACCKKCNSPLFPVSQNREYSDVEILLNKHDLECKGTSNSNYACVKCNRDLSNVFNKDKKYPPTVYRFGDKVYCEDCGLIKKNKEVKLDLNK